MERLTERAEIDKCPGVWVKEGFARDGKRTWFNGYDEGYSAISKCAKYEDLEEQGKMLILPCAVRDILYEPRPERGIITEYTVTGFSYCGNTIFAHWRLNSGIYNHLDGVTVNNIGMSVFTTREEAEAALKELCTSNGP